ncbi:hypothetical protein DICVIV_12982 [Dictyocaulus viviparus]|uniref:Uncharacterized protein n=1 Tax=Dictyocaulus viviparus TaxID=29172 RepID=A0A0D8XF27_DICVI|nr:hypothetical protein DICVIV_12982 [Dictyocaulus viviparus]
MMKSTMFTIFILAGIFSAFVWGDVIDDANIDQVMSRVYRAVLMKSKRSPSMGLSLAEYMASPQGGDNFHFIPSGRK